MKKINKLCNQSDKLKMTILTAAKSHISTFLQFHFQLWQHECIFLMNKQYYIQKYDVKHFHWDCNTPIFWRTFVPLINHACQVAFAVFDAPKHSKSQNMCLGSPKLICRWSNVISNLKIKKSNAKHIEIWKKNNTKKQAQNRTKTKNKNKSQRNTPLHINSMPQGIETSPTPEKMVSVNTEKFYSNTV